ncbi:YceD family protein [Allofustis seminis]|uniref:YceD family protein n=1 Tax=Allofustis seminis TaxID=166939 RepID=UPI00036CF6AF|nr:YceD family protein [Allofustis seminis]
MKLKWALTELRKQPNEPFIISGEADLKKDLMKRNKDIIDVSPIKISGSIVPENMDQFLVTATLQLTLVLPSTRSLTPTRVPLELPFTELYISPDRPAEEAEQDLVFHLEKHSIDLQKPIEDTILTALPLKVLTEEERKSEDLPSGNDWKMLSEEDYQQKRHEPVLSERGSASPFAVLKDLFPETDEESSKN